MYFVEMAQKLANELIGDAVKNNDFETVKKASMISNALHFAKFEEQGLLCGECGMAILEEMAEVTQGMCHCGKH